MIHPSPALSVLPRHLGKKGLWVALIFLSSLNCFLSGSVFPLQSFIDTAIADGQSTIVIPPGRYEVAPTDGVHLRLYDLKNVTIVASGVEMVCTETTQAIHVKNCQNLRIVGLTIDYDPLPFTQGRIVEIAEDRGSHVIEIMDGFPPAEDAYVFKQGIYSADGALRYGDYYQFQLEVVSSKRLRIFGLNPGKDGGQQLGDIVVVAAQKLTGRYLPHAIVVHDSVGTQFEDIQLFSSPCFGFLEVACSGSIYRNCVIDRREGRMRSLNADAFHSKHAKVGPRIINCTAMWQGDDAVNICGEYYLVESVDGRNLRLFGERNFYIEPGDPIELVAPDGKRRPEALVISIDREGSPSAKDRAFIESLPLNSQVKNSLRKVYSVQLDREVDVPTGSVVAAINRKGNGFAVIDCQFGNNRSRGILIKASEGEIRGNHLINTHMESIKISPEYHWLESGFSRNVVVENNEIINPGKEAIKIAGIGPYSGHENIQVMNNNIWTGVSPAIRIESVRNGKVSSNTILGVDGNALPGAIQERFCENLLIETAK
jgi:hypothetical protein